MPRFKQVPKIIETMSQKNRIRNIGLVAHIDHGKTSTADSLLAEAGLLPPEMAGKAKALDFLDEEQRRGITIKNANISLLYHTKGQTHLINLIDTPGHVDFSGKVTRALRAIDSAVVIVDSVEEIMAQTETVTRQALQELVRPILFINKVDRLVNELKLRKDEMERKFARIIRDFNSLIEMHAESEFRKNWKVSPSSGTVVLGSALHRWGFTPNAAESQGLDFAHVIEIYHSGKHPALSSRLPLSRAILDTVVSNCPSPVEAQKYRIPKIWGGVLDSKVGRAMVECDENGPAMACITGTKLEKEDVVNTARLFSGTIKEGDTVYLINAERSLVIKNVFLYMSAFLERTSEIPAGNIIALTGLSNAKIGETLIHERFKETLDAAFETLKYISEPVMTVAVEPEKPTDLPRLAEALRRLTVEDENLSLKFDQKTGEYLLSGMGELHLETAQTFLKEHLGNIEIVTSKPAVDYSETIMANGSAVSTKTSDKQSSLCVRVRPSGDKEFEALLLDRPPSLMGWDERKNVFTQPTPREELTRQVKEAVIKGFIWACKTGPLCERPMRSISVELLDVQIKEDSLANHLLQVEHAVGRAILASLLTAKPVILEPFYLAEISTPIEFFGKCTNIIASRRGKVVASENRGMLTIVKTAIPVAESFGLASELRSATSGRAFWQGTHTSWQRVPERIEADTIRKLRTQKGLAPELPKPEKFASEKVTRLQQD